MRTDTTPLRLTAHAFTDMADGSPLITVDGTPFTGLPDHPVGLNDIAAYCADRAISAADKDALWADLVDRARQCSEPWATVCAGLALPGLRNAAKRASWLAPSWAERHDIESAAVFGFIDALTVLDLSQPRIARRLCHRAFAAARRYAIDLSRYSCSLVSTEFESHPPRPQFDHVDFVLARWVHEGILTTDQAKILGATYINDQKLKDYAAENGMSLSAACRLRQTAKRQVSNAIMGDIAEHGLPLRCAEFVTV